MKVLWSLSTRIAAQAFLALSSYLVSISAAHSLGTASLAVFFVGWTLESMWIGAVRMVVVPALLLHETAPRATALIGAASLLAMPLVLAVFITSSGLPTTTQWLLATSVLTLGAYEIARSLLSRGIANALALPIADAGMFLLALLGVLTGGLVKVNGLDASLASLSLSSLLVTVSIVAVLGLRRSRATPEVFRTWLRATWPLLRLGSLEWLVFFITSTAGLALLGVVGGPTILAGIRLAETLVAPIGLLSSALPYVVANALRADDRSSGPWPRAVRHVWLLLTLGTVLYLAVIQFAPAGLLGLLVGTHVAIARQASLGLGLGVIASVFAATSTLVMKQRKQVKTLSRLRAVELAVTLPAVAAGASTGTIVGAGLGVSSSQLFPALVQAALHIRAVRKS